MNTITIKYNGVLPTVTWERETASGQVKTLRAVFVFSPDWDAYPIRTAVFEGCGIKVKRKLDASNACDVPADIVKHAGRLSVGAFANKAEGDPWPRYCGRPAVENIPQGVCPARACDAEDEGSEYEQFLAELNGKVDRYQGEQNAGCAMVVDEDGFLRPGTPGNIDEEQIAAMINAYLEKHPLSIPPMSADVLGGAKLGENLKMSEDGHLSVDTADTAEGDNTRPITSAAVNTIVGNIEILLETI